MLIPNNSISPPQQLMLPQFKIFWMDQYHHHLQSSIQKFESVLFNTKEVVRGDLNQFDSIEFEQHIRSLLRVDPNNHVLVITSLSKGKGYQVLEILKDLKKEEEHDQQRVYSCVYSRTALENPVIQNLCRLKYGADFVSSENTKHALLEVESFVAQVYQKSFYPKLMKSAIQLLRDDPGDDYNTDPSLISPTHPLLKMCMTLQEEISREALKHKGLVYDSKWELVPLRKIAHNLHLQQSACLGSYSHQPLVQQPQFLVMIQTGAINPPHKMHQQGFHIAKKFVENYESMMLATKSKPKMNRELWGKQVRPIKVVGCFMSPSHDKYIQRKASKHGYKDKRVYNSTERLNMCRLQTEDDPLTCEYPWEAKQPTFISFSQVGNSCSKILRSAECPISLLMPKNPVSGHYQDSSSYLRVSYTCGSDLILRAGLRKFDYFDDMLSLVLGRQGVDVGEVMQSVNETHGNLPVYYVEMDNMKENGLSSTEVRKCLENISQKIDVENSKKRLEKVLDSKVLNYIINDCQ